jgi:hypothetical protein
VKAKEKREEEER